MSALPTREEPSYFGAGPAVLPTHVLEQAAKDLINYDNLGLGVGEISHRSKEATHIINDTKENLIKLMDIPTDTHEVFFMQGGGTTGFSSIASNLFFHSYDPTKKDSEQKKGLYLIDGSWSLKSFQEAQRLGYPAESIKLDTNNNEKGVSMLSEIQYPENLSYVYICENETVHGIEYPVLPSNIPEGVELCADLSSDILSRKIDVSKYGVIMAGAQKNIGLAGLTVYIVKKTILNNIAENEKILNNESSSKYPKTPIAFDWPTVVKNNSAYNTIPIFTLHIMNLVFKNLLAKGGVAQQELENDKKSKLLYQTLDKYPNIFNLPVSKNFRSKMNVVFTLKDSSLNDEFLNNAEKQNLKGLKGHRSVGGFRASLYNAVSLNAVEKLVKYIEEFASTVESK
ncbi:hypothetical protein ACO0QE_003479 [Hanseniaspora vineae]